MAIPRPLRSALISTFREAVNRLQAEGAEQEDAPGTAKGVQAVTGTEIRVLRPNMYEINTPGAGGSDRILHAKALFVSAEVITGSKVDTQRFLVGDTPETQSIYETALLEVVAKLLDSQEKIGLYSSPRPDDAGEEESEEMATSAAEQLSEIQEILRKTNENLEESERLRKSNTERFARIIGKLTQDHPKAEAIRRILPRFTVQ